MRTMRELAMAGLRRSAGPVALIWVVCLCAADGWAQGYPAKPVRYLVPFSAGSGSDTIGRIVAGGLAQAFGQ